MTNFLKTAVACLATIALFAAQNLQAQSSLSASDQKEIEATYAKWTEMFKTLDASEAGSLLTENAVEINPMGTVIRGRAALVESYKQLFEFFKTMPVPDSREEKMLDYRGRYLAPGLVELSYTEETTSRFGEKTVVEKMSQLVVLRKVDGKWLCELIALTPVTEMPDMAAGDKK